MSTEQTEAIVLRVIPFSETSLIVTLYTRDLGRVSAIAKGARRPKSPFDGSLDLLAVCRIVMICKAGDALELLTEAKLQRRFRAGQKSLVRLYCGYYVAEMVRLWTDEGAANELLYDLTVGTIAAIDGTGDALMAVIRFELGAMRLLGTIPATQSCVVCGSDVDPGVDRVAFAHDLGGVLCQACRVRQRGVVSIRREVIAEMARLQFAGPESGVDTSGAICSDSADCANYRELRATLSRYITTTLGNVPRTQSLLPASWVSH